MSGRSRTEVMHAILQVVASGEGRKMRMMYGAFLSYEKLEEYADFMIKEGMVYLERGSQLYRLTPKGEAFLRAAEQLEAPRIRE